MEDLEVLEDNRDVHVALEASSSGVHVGHTTINQNLRPALQKLCDSNNADPATKAHAMELLTALDLSKQMAMRSGQAGPNHHLRPKTAMARLQRAAASMPQEFNTKQIDTTFPTAYETTNNYFYQQPPSDSASKAVRPMSSQIQQAEPDRTPSSSNNFARLFMSTTYGREFSKKTTQPKSKPFRAASASGVRSNNPHPSEDFLVWRYRRPMTATEKIEAAASSSTPSTDIKEPQNHQELNDETYDKAVRGKCITTYQLDFNPNNQENLDASKLAAAGTRRPKIYRHSPKSTNSSAYQIPSKLPQPICVPLTRYHKYHKDQQGVLPGAGISRHHLGIRPKTMYETDLNDRVAKGSDIRHVSSDYNTEMLTNLLKTTNSQAEYAYMLKLHHEMEVRKQKPLSIPIPMERRMKKERIGGHMKPPVGAHAWLSTWPGPTLC